MAKKKMTQEEFDAELKVKESEIPALRTQLTKRNADFMYRFQDEIKKVNYPGNEVLLEHFMLTELIEGQKTGKTAQQLYITPQKWAEHVVNKPLEGHVEPPFWQLAVDGGLLIGGVFALVAGISSLGVGPVDDTNGLAILIINYIMGGLAMASLTKLTPDPDAPKGEQGYRKYIIVSVIIVALWLGLITPLAVYLPDTINIHLPSGVYIVVGALSLLVRWYFRKTYNLTGGLLASKRN